MKKSKFISKIYKVLPNLILASFSVSASNAPPPPSPLSCYSPAPNPSPLVTLLPPG